MLYAAKLERSGAMVALAAHLADLERVSREAEAAGDVELAEEIESHLLTVQRCPSAGVGAVTLVMRSGRRVPLRDARAHIRRGAAPVTTGRGGSQSGAKRHGRAGATMASDLAAVNAALRAMDSEIRRPAPARARDDDYFDDDDFDIDFTRAELRDLEEAERERWEEERENEINCL